LIKPAFADKSVSPPCIKNIAQYATMLQKIVDLLISILLISVLFTVGCSAQTEEQALRSLREMTRDGSLPPEAVVASIESRFAGKPTGALAKLLHAEYDLSQAILPGRGDAALRCFSQIYKGRRSRLWLRGKSLQSAGTRRSTECFCGTNTRFS
jgi:hypothetical protein